MSKDENSFSEYFAQNERIIVVLSLFCGFLFTSITLLFTTLQNRGGILGHPSHYSIPNPGLLLLALHSLRQP